MIPPNYTLHETRTPDDYDPVSGGKMKAAGLLKIEVWIDPDCGHGKHNYIFTNKETTNIKYFRKRVYGYES